MSNLTYQKVNGQRIWFVDNFGKTYCYMYSQISDCPKYLEKIPRSIREQLQNYKADSVEKKLPDETKKSSESKTQLNSYMLSYQGRVFAFPKTKHETTIETLLC